MPFNDGIPKINSYSLTDFNDFEQCPFRFFVRHHLDKKYEIDESSPPVALGNLLDQSIKKFHKAKYYGCEVQDLEGVVKAAARQIKEEVEEARKKGKSHFYAATLQFLTPELIDQAIEVFQSYYLKREKKIRRAIDEVGFCEYVINGGGDILYKLWGGPDTLEEGDDGLPEVVDYKSRQDIKKGKANLDINLIAKIYVLLCSQKLLSKGHKKARFVVRLWQDPLDESLYEEFNLASMSGEESLFKQKIERILRVSEFKMCKGRYCAACKSAKKGEFLKELEKRGFKLMSGEQFSDRELIFGGT